MFERPQSGERAILIHAAPGRTTDPSDKEEFAELARSAGAVIVDQLTGSRRSPNSRYFIGKGKLEELRASIELNDADLVISSAPLRPSQERNIEKSLQCRVLDRSGLILDIFAQRARSFEGKLQVELAQLRHLSTRLVRGWTHLERQKGGIGLRGPGETQLETDRRLLDQRIRRLHARLDRLAKRRGLARQRRLKREIPTVSLVGYTNAGKSTLLSVVSAAKPRIADYPFTTLHPNLGIVSYRDYKSFVMADIPGIIEGAHDGKGLGLRFLRHIERNSLLLFMVPVDSKDIGKEFNILLGELGKYNPELLDKPRLLAITKSDLLDDELLYEMKKEVPDMPHVFISSVTGNGLDQLKDVIWQMLND